MLRLDGVGDKTLDVVEEFWSSRPLSAFKESYDPILWTIGLGSSFLWMVFDFARNVYRVGKFVIPTRRLFANPPKEKPAPGQLVSVVGIVSSSDGEDPVRVKIREELTSGRGGDAFFREVSRKIKARPFSLAVLSWEQSIDIDPGKAVELRTGASVSEWLYDKKTGATGRFRSASLEDGERAIVTGVLEEEIITEILPGDYRVAKEKTHKRVIIRPAPQKPMIISTERLLDEVSACAGKVNWLIAAFIGAYVTSLVNAIRSNYTEKTMMTTGWIFIIFVVVRLFTMKNRIAWFDRPKSRPDRAYLEPK